MKPQKTTMPSNTSAKTPTIQNQDVAAVVVTYHPDMTLLKRALHSLSKQVGHIITVDNGSEESTVTALKQLLTELDTQTQNHKPNQLLALKKNLGIAAAQNRGIMKAKTLGAKAVLLLDHDSLTPPQMVTALLESYHTHLNKGEKIGAVGPLISEERAEELLVYKDTWLGPRKVKLSPATPPRPQPTNHKTNHHDPENKHTDIETAFLLASGCLIPLSVLEEVGPMNEKFFIDHVDLEWGVRARNIGYTLLASSSTSLIHHLGDKVIQLPGRTQPIHIHAPIRCYYLARNTVALIRGQVVPPGWKLGYLIWLSKYAGFNSLLVKPRLTRTRLLLQGIFDGIRPRCGALT